MAAGFGEEEKDNKNCTDIPDNKDKIILPSNTSERNSSNKSAIKCPNIANTL
jgi:hypothetical protein